LKVGSHESITASVLQRTTPTSAPIEEADLLMIGDDAETVAKPTIILEVAAAEPVVRELDAVASPLKFTYDPVAVGTVGVPGASRRVINDDAANIAVDTTLFAVPSTMVAAAVVLGAIKRVVGIEADDTGATVLLELAEFAHGAMTHCVMRSLSTYWPFCFAGVRARTYELEKLPAAQATNPTKTSEFWLMKVFWAQKFVKH
jgi:hypothetical protein